MEISLDIALVRDILANEHASATAQIRTLGPLAAYEQSQLRHDQSLSTAGDARCLACTAGCSWCCYFTVDVRPIEVFGILQFMERALSPEERQRIGAELNANAQRLFGSDAEQRVRQNIKCPFLSAGRCTIYAARPQTCRNYHATDATGCRMSFEQPENLDIDPEFAPLTYQIGAAHVDGFAKAMADFSYDHTAYEMNAALAQALAEPERCRQRFEAGQPPFAGLVGQDVPLEMDV